MKIKLLLLGALFALQCATTQAQIPITSSATAPATGADDQFYLPGAVDEATGAMNTSGNGVNGSSGANDGLTYVSSDRASKGQSFTTGSNPNGYTISSVTVRHILQTNSLSNGTWAGVTSGNAFAFRFGTISGSTLTPTLTTTATYSGTAINGGNNSAPYYLGSGLYLTFDLSGAGIATLSPNTTYFFELASSGPWFELHNTRTNATSYTRGTAFAGNNNGALDSDLSVSLSHGEFAFVAKLAAIGAPSVVATVNPASGLRGQSFTVTATVTPGGGTVTNVNVNLSAIGGSASASLVRSNANVYTNTFTVPSGASLGTANLTVTAKDTTPLTGTAGVSFTVLPGNLVWNGGSLAGNTWSDNANWLGNVAPLAGDIPIFAGTTRPTPDMNNNYSISSLVFSNTAGSFTIGSSTGGTLTIGSGGIENDSTNTQTLNVPIVLGAAQTFNAAAGSLTLNSNITGGATLTLSGTNTMRLAGTGNSTISDLLVNGGQMSVTAGTVNVSDTTGDLTKIDNGATVVVSGGSLNIGGSTGWFPIGNTAGTTSTLIVSGGAVNVTNGYGSEVGRIGSGVLTINSGSFLSWDFNNINGFVVGDQGASSGGTVNLNGGILSFNYLVCNNGNNNFYFNGGTLKPTISRTTFWNNSTQMSAQVRDGGAIVDTAGLNVTIGQALVHSAVVGDNATDGGLTKVGNGTLLLTNYCSYTGPTVVNAGTLWLTGGCDLTGPTVVNAGTLAVDTTQESSVNALTVINASFSLSLDNGLYGVYAADSVTFQGNTVLNLDYGMATSPSSAAIYVYNSVSNTGTNTINITGQYLTVGQYPLIYTGGSVPTNNFKLGTLPIGVVATLVDSGASLDLLITLSGQTLAWYGANGSGSPLTTWDINSSMNWNSGGAKYLQYATNSYGDFVTFDDTLFSASDANVTLNSRVVPVSVTFNNNSTPYSITGSGGIGGATSLTVSGTSSVFLGTSNNYTGGTLLNAGTLIINSGAALGAGSNLLTLAGGTLQVAGNMVNPHAATLNGTANVSTGAGSVTVNTLTNVISRLQMNPSSGSGLIVNGEGTLMLSGANDFAYFYDGDATVGGNLLITNGSFVISQDNGNSKFDQGGNVTIANGGVLAVRSANNAWFPIGDTAGTTSTMTIAGGTFIVTNQWGLQLARNGDAVLTLNSGNLIVNDQAGANLGMSMSEGGGNSTFNLNGGRATLLKFRPAGGVETVNLNGGTLSGTASHDDYFSFSANVTANVRNGGVVVDTTGFDLAIGQPLLHSTIPGDNAIDGGLTKLGNGALTLTGANTYTGNTTVNGGTLEIAQATLATNSTVSIASDAVLQLDFSTTNIVTAIVLNGVAQPSGVYNSTTAAPYITGSGSLIIPSTGPGTFTSTPGITSFTLNGANVVISGTNGQAGDAYYLLESTDLALPLSQWTTVATNVLGADGAFTFTGTNAVTPGSQQQFYILSNTNSNH